MKGQNVKNPFVTSLFLAITTSHTKFFNFHGRVGDDEPLWWEKALMTYFYYRKLWKAWDKSACTFVIINFRKKNWCYFSVRSTTL